MKIEPLHCALLAETASVASELFPWETEHQIALQAALYPQAHAEFLASRRLEAARFWAARFNGRVVGLAGLYDYRYEGRSVLRLWTTVEDEYCTAIRLYEKRGFTAEDYPPLPGESWRTLVMSLGLNGTTPIPWLSVGDRPALCGRVTPPAAVQVA